MLEIENTNKFGKVTAAAIAKVELTVTDAQNKKRWINAIAKAVAQIELHGEFMTWMPETKSLLIWSQDSNDIHAANGVCDCEAYKRGLACWHRAAARLVRIYLELPENVAPNFPNAEKLEPNEIPYLPNTREPIRVEKYGSVRLPVYN
jgi:hypothetical protein